MPYTQSDTQSQGVYSYRTLSAITRSQGLCTHLYTQSNTQSQGFLPHLTHSPAHSVRASVHTLHTVQHTVSEPLYTPYTQSSTQSQGLVYTPYTQSNTQSQSVCTHLIHSPAHSLRASVHTLHTVQRTVSEPLYTPYAQSST